MISGFKNHTMYRHRNFVDVDMFVVKSFDVGYIKLKVRWWNRAGYFICEDRVTIEYKGLCNWEELK